jgi:hypothetical protein
MTRIALFVLLFLVLGPAHALTVFRESEPNNNIPRAQFLNTSDNKILVLGDRVRNRSSDWYLVWGQRSSVFDILVRTPSSINDSILGLFDSAGREIAFNDNLGGSYGLNSGIFHYRIPTSGFYYIAVSAQGDRNFRGGGIGRETSEWTYNLSINRTATPEPSEWALIGMSMLGVGGLMRRATLKARNG